MGKVAQELASGEYPDAVYGKIKLSPLSCTIAETTEFQRLDRIKQLGGVFRQFKDAKHSRYQHSIGTAHLARKLMEHLKEEQDKSPDKFSDESKIDESDALCVEIAALCHDLGHGPYSRLFQDKFLPLATRSKKWKHKDYSCKILDLILDRLKSDNDMDDVAKAMLADKRSKDFIYEMIRGSKGQLSERSYKGRKRGKWYLYEILSDKESIVDVSKCDYIARDFRALSLDMLYPEKFLQLLTVRTEQDKMSHIRFKQGKPMFFDDINRWVSSLHKHVYQHPTVNAVEHMICDAMLAADKYGAEISSKAWFTDDLLSLDDDVITGKMLSGKYPLAAQIWKRINDGDYYELVAIQNREGEIPREDICREIRARHPDLEDKIRITVWHYTFVDQDPIGQEWKTDTADTLKIEKTIIQVFCVDRKEKEVINNMLNGSSGERSGTIQ